MTSPLRTQFLWLWRRWGRVPRLFCFQNHRPSRPTEPPHAADAPSVRGRCLRRAGTGVAESLRRGANRAGGRSRIRLPRNGRASGLNIQLVASARCSVHFGHGQTGGMARSGRSGKLPGSARRFSGTSFLTLRDVTPGRLRTEGQERNHTLWWCTFRKPRSHETSSWPPLPLLHKRSTTSTDQASSSRDANPIGFTCTQTNLLLPCLGKARACFACLSRRVLAATPAASVLSDRPQS